MLDQISELAKAKQKLTEAENLSMQHIEDSDPRKRTAAILLHALQIFAQKQLDFFEKGFNEDQATDQTNGFLLPVFEAPENTEYSKLYPFQGINRQIDCDFFVIQCAISDRESVTPIPKALNQKELTSIELADRLAYLALQPASPYLGIGTSTVLTYFQKSSLARVIPYAPVAIIGVEGSAIDDPFDLVATSHEIGHYVYSRCLCELTSDPIDSQNFYETFFNELSLEDDQKLCVQNWFEEIFADVYACLIAGPISALSMPLWRHDWRKPEELTEDDADHPLPALRPYIYTETLKQMARAVSAPTTVAAKLDQAAAALESQWSARALMLQAKPKFRVRRKQAIIDESKLVELSDSPFESETSEMVIVLRNVVEKLCSGILKSLVENQAKSLGNLWYRDPTPAYSPELQIWRTGFLEYIKEKQQRQSEGSDFPELEFVTHNYRESLCLVTADRQVELLAVGSTNFPFEAVRDDAMANGGARNLKIVRRNTVDHVEDPKWWLYILDAGGWTSQGPGPGNVTKG